MPIYNRKPLDDLTTTFNNSSIPSPMNLSLNNFNNNFSYFNSNNNNNNNT